MNLAILMALAAIIIGVQLPSYMRRIGMPNKDRIGFTLIIFSLLALAWLAVQGLGMINMRI